MSIGRLLVVLVRDTPIPILAKMTRSRLWFFLIIFCALPYLVDVVYCEDLTPSHFAQAVLGEGEDVDPPDTKAGMVVPGDQFDCFGTASAVWRTGLACQVGQARALVPSQFTLLASLTSRPPPIF